MLRLILPGIGSTCRFNTLNLLDFELPASHMENLKIQPFEQTLMQEGGGLEVGFLLDSYNSLPI